VFIFFSVSPPKILMHACSTINFKLKSCEMSAVTLINPMAGQSAAHDMRLIIKSTLCVSAVMILLVIIGDYHTSDTYSGPLPRGHDGNSIVLNLAAGMRKLWQSMVGEGAPRAEL
jgi:hypothetical protein